MVKKLFGRPIEFLGLRRELLSRKVERARHASDPSRVTGMPREKQMDQSGPASAAKLVRQFRADERSHRGGPAPPPANGLYQVRRRGARASARVWLCHLDCTWG
jgi:hypothetical protein